MSSAQLTPVHYVILGCLASFGPQTSYDLKQSSQRIAGWMWTFPHTQLYTEPPKLVGAGLVDVEEEECGRRRRTWSITEHGRRELGRWAIEPPHKGPEVRDLAFLKLYFAHEANPDDIVELARDQAELHQARADWVQAVINSTADNPDARFRRTIGRFGVTHAQMLRDFWLRIADDPTCESERFPPERSNGKR